MLGMGFKLSWWNRCALGKVAHRHKNKCACIFQRWAHIMYDKQKCAHPTKRCAFHTETRTATRYTPILVLDNLGMCLGLKLRKTGKKWVTLCAIIFTQIDCHTARTALKFACTYCIFACTCRYFACTAGFPGRPCTHAHFPVPLENITPRHNYCDVSWNYHAVK